MHTATVANEGGVIGTYLLAQGTAQLLIKTRNAIKYTTLYSN
jgi:hypothetical protein